MHKYINNIVSSNSVINEFWNNLNKCILLETKSLETFIFYKKKIKIIAWDWKIIKLKFNIQLYIFRYLKTKATTKV